MKSDTLRRVAAALTRRHTEVVVPVYKGQRGHPVGFSDSCGPALCGLHGDTGASSVLRMYKTRELIVDDIGCVTDIDTVNDLLNAESLLRGFAGTRT